MSSSYTTYPCFDSDDERTNSHVTFTYGKNCRVLSMDEPDHIESYDKTTEQPVSTEGVDYISSVETRSHDEESLGDTAIKSNFITEAMRRYRDLPIWKDKEMPASTVNFMEAMMKYQESSIYVEETSAPTVNDRLIAPNYSDDPTKEAMARRLRNRLAKRNCQAKHD